MSIKIKARLHKSDFHLNINSDFELSGITGVFGPSGCGKTTLLRLIAGLDWIRDCEISVNGVQWQSKNIFLPTHERKVGFVFQEPSLFPHMSVKDNIFFGKKRTDSASSCEKINKAINVLGVKHLLQRWPNNLSGGEQQRVAIARALAGNPAMLLLDEPLAALDYERKQEILFFLIELNSIYKIPIFYVSHSRDEIKKISSNVIVLENGSIKEYGATENLFHSTSFN